MALAANATNDTPVLLTERLELSFGTTGDADVLFPFLHGDEGRAITDVFAHNERGLALVDELSFARVACLPDYVVKRGRRVDGVAFAITKAAWQARPHR